MSTDKRVGKQYYKINSRENIKKSLQKLVHAVQNDEIEVSKANCICKIIQLELDILDDEIMEQMDILTEQIEKLSENGGI